MSGIAWGLVAGAAMGAAFFGGLWWTVARIPGSRRPAMLVGVSLVVRLAAVGGGLLLLILVWGWPAGVAALPGILVARAAAVRWAHGSVDTPRAGQPDTRDAGAGGRGGWSGRREGGAPWS